MNGLALYFKADGATSYEDLSVYLQQEGLTYDQQENELAQFTFTLKVPKDSTGEFIYPEPGDEFILCETSERLRLLNNSLGGKVEDITAYPYQWDATKSTWVCDFMVTVRQFNPCIEEVAINEKSPKLLSELLDDIIINNTGDILGGTINGETYPKYKLLAPDINVGSFDFLGDPLQSLTEVVKSIDYKWKMIGFSAPSGSEVDRLFQILIYSTAGIAPARGSAWENGINNSTYRSFRAPNNEYSSATHDGTDDEPAAFWTEKDLSIRKHAYNLKNLIKVFGVREEEGDVLQFIQRYAARGETNFILPHKARDIYYAGRKVFCRVNGITSSDVFDIWPASKAEQLVRDQAKLTNQKLVFRMEIGTNQWSPFVGCTISGTTVTADEDIIGIANNAGVEFIHTAELINENTLESDRPTYYSTKHCKPTELGSVTFDNATAPSFELEQVFTCLYSALYDFNKKLIFNSSIRKHGLRMDKRDLPLPITFDQLDQLERVFEKLAEPIKEITVTSLRPEPVELGWIIPIDLTGLLTENLVVEAVKSTYIHYKGQNRRPLIEQVITLSSYRDSLKDLLLSLRNRVEKNQAVLEDVKEDRGRSGFGFGFKIVSDVETTGYTQKIIYGEYQAAFDDIVKRSDLDGSNVETLIDMGGIGGYELAYLPFFASDFTYANLTIYGGLTEAWQTNIPYDGGGDYPSTSNQNLSCDININGKPTYINNSRVYYSDHNGGIGTQVLIYDPIADIGAGYSARYISSDPTDASHYVLGIRNSSGKIELYNNSGTNLTNTSFSEVYTYPRIDFGGGRIACLKDNGANKEITIMDIDGSNEETITSGYVDTAPAWHPNGREIYFSDLTNSRAGGIRTIYKVDIYSKVVTDTGLEGKYPYIYEIPPS